MIDAIARAILRRQCRRTADLLAAPPQSCWIVTDGAVGNEKQCLALTHYLGLKPEIFRVRLREPWNSLAPHFRPGGRRAILGPLRDRLDGELPDLLITAGRRATLVSTTLRRLGRCFTVHILDPRIDPRHFDRVICPRHDGLEGDNVLTLLGAPNEVDDDTLALARERFPSLGELPRPRVALLIGASNSAYTIDRDHLERLADFADRRRGTGSVMVTPSRRSGADLVDFVRKRFSDVPGQVWTGPQDGDNPYMGFLAWADRIVVTADSVNMVSEAAATGVPVHCEPPGPGTPKFRRFHQLMRETGHVIGFDQPDSSAPPLRETRAVAARIAEALERRS